MAARTARHGWLQLRLAQKGREGASGALRLKGEGKRAISSFCLPEILLVKTKLFTQSFALRHSPARIGRKDTNSLAQLIVLHHVAPVSGGLPIENVRI